MPFFIAVVSISMVDFRGQSKGSHMLSFGQSCYRMVVQGTYINQNVTEYVLNYLHLKHYLVQVNPIH